MPDYILSPVSGNLLRAFVPVADSPVAVNDVNPGAEAVKNGLIDFGSVELGHTMISAPADRAVNPAQKFIIGQNGTKFRWIGSAG